MACFGTSVIFHTFYTINLKYYRIMQRLDMAGICILIFGSSFSYTYYHFKSRPELNQFYLTTSLVATIVVFVLSMMERIQQWKSVRSFLFILLAVIDGLPAIHSIYINLTTDDEFMYIPLSVTSTGFILTLISYALGFIVYTFKIPERFFPKTFDIWMNSHCIWHIGSIFGSIFFLYTILCAYDYRNIYN